MPSIRLPGKKKKLKAVSVGTVNPVHTIPAANGDGEEEINLSHIVGWDDLTIQKQRYLVEFSKRKLKKKRAALAVGLDTSKITDWLKSDPDFARIFDDIQDLHVEGVEEMDYLAAYSNGASRGRFLKNRSKHYSDEEQPAQLPQRITNNNQTNIYAVLNNEETQKKGLAGVQQVFNSLKEQGEVTQLKEKETD